MQYHLTLYYTIIYNMISYEPQRGHLPEELPVGLGDEAAAGGHGQPV